MIVDLILRLFKSKWGWLNIIPVFAGLAVFSIQQSHGADIGLLGFAHEVGFSGFGLFLFFSGFGIVKERWIMRNTPTSTIRGAAMGLCELTGKAEEKFPLKSPLRYASCVYYEFRIEAERRDYRGRSQWVLQREGRSANYFYINDGTGKMLVDPLNCEAFLSNDMKWIESVGGTRMRYSESFICPGEDMYVLGTVRKFVENVPDRNYLILARLREIKEDKEKMKAFDTDGDGTISAEEWDRARAHVEEDLLKEELARPVNADDDNVIAKGDGEKTFIIADCNEKKLSQRLFVRGAGFCFGGCTLVIVMCVSMVARAGLLPAAFAIPWVEFYRH